MSSKGIKRLVILIWVLCLMFVIGLPLSIQIVKWNPSNLFGELPSLEKLERPDPDLSSILYSADGEILGKYFRYNRTQVTYEELSPELINTLLVTEDIRFKEHAGVDLKGLLRAASGFFLGQNRGGGSTITMQLAENLYRTETDNNGKLHNYSGIGKIITKIKEYIISVQLESSYTKEEILAMYLNTIEFGSNSYGVKVACKTYFNKIPSEITYKEAAVLVGLINKPTRFNPVLNPEFAKQKRTEVLYNVYKYGLIDKFLFDSLDASDFGLNYLVENHNEGLAPYFRTRARNFLMYWANENGYDIFDDGLRIYTTIDSRMQMYAENAVESHMKDLQKLFDEHWDGAEPWRDEDGNTIENFLENSIKRSEYYRYLRTKYKGKPDSIDHYLNKKKPMTVFSWDGEIDTTFSHYDSINYYKRFLQTGFMAMDPESGHIKAWVGGINHKYFKYDHVKQGKRQPGSVLKPMVFASAISTGYSPCFPVVDAQVIFELPGQEPPTWSPNNFNSIYTGEVMTIRQAMARSVNSITAYIMKIIGPATVVDYAHRIGINSDLQPVPSLCLGAGGDVSLFEMVGAYSTFVNKGTHTEPFFISRIEDKNGNVIQEFIPERKEALNEETAYLMLYMLRGATEESGGTGHGLGADLKADNEIGAKTGTTQNGSDGWFMGVTKDIVAGAWVGGDDRSIHWKSWSGGAGAKTALPIWKRFMTDVYGDSTLNITKGQFERPTRPLSVEIDCSKNNNTIEVDSTLQDQLLIDMDSLI